MGLQVIKTEILSAQDPKLKGQRGKEVREEPLYHSRSLFPKRD